MREYLPDFKVCYTCGKKKAKEEFYLRPIHSSGLHSSCIKCQKKIGNINKRMRLSNMSEAQYIQLLKSQNNVCAICNKSERTMKMDIFKNYVPIIITRPVNLVVYFVINVIVV